MGRVPIQGLRPSEEHLKAKYITMLRKRLSQFEGSSKCSFFSLFLEDAPLLSIVASHIPRFFARPKKKKERKKMATLRGADCHRIRDVRVKHLVMEPGNRLDRPL